MTSSSSTSSTSNDSILLSQVYTKGLGYIFLIAFLSYHVQYPGLSSIAGIEPSTRTFQRAFPSLYYPVSKQYIDVDGWVEVMTMTGIIISMIIASGISQHAFLYLIVTAIYYILVVLGGQFYTFQWDILLIEVGFLTAMCFAPWRMRRITGNHHYQNTSLLVGCWPLRFLLFKLMFMSGIVKIQAECPTWQNLTALEYHFATQCLPGPLAWYAHQLHPSLLRLGVAATFLIEIPATFLLLSSSRIRRIGAWMQIVLQGLIIVTGNYNFFNLLTILLCVPCMIGTDDPRERSVNAQSFAKYMNRIETILCVLFLAISCKEMFQMEHYIDEKGKDRMWFKLSTSRHDCNDFAEIAIPMVILSTVVCTLKSSGILRRAGNENVHNISRFSSLTHTLVCVACIFVTAMPLLDLVPNSNTQHQFNFVKQSTRTFRRQTSVVSHGYGLFRRMTGVGKEAVTGINTLGLPPSVVARPEIILEAIIVDTDGSENSTITNEWQELNFGWKPGPLDRRPRQVAPHQPRLDWRMWFAALGSVQHNAWLVSFIDKILSGCPKVVDLLDEPDLRTNKKKVQMIRAQLYEYDFTRWDTEWARRNPDAHILGGDDTTWWTRKAVGQYFPALDSDNKSLKEFLQHTGYAACKSEKDRCNGLGAPCHIVYYLRQIFSGSPLLFSLLAILSCAIFDMTRSSKRRKMKQE